MNATTINTTVTGLTENFLITTEKIKKQLKEKDYVLKINGVEVPPIELDNVIINLSNTTKSQRKAMAKRMYNYEKKGTIKTINMLFHVLKNMQIIEEKVKVDISHREADIQKARKVYVKLRTEAEAARVAYKELKGDFYK